MSQPRSWARRRFCAEAAALGMGTLAGLPPLAARAADPPPEVRRIRLVHSPAICLSPQYLAEELLRLEGFTEVEYVDFSRSFPSNAVADGHADMTMDTAPMLIAALDAGQPLLPLAGLHAGCYALFGNDRIRAVRDLKGRAVAVSEIGSGEYLFVSSMAAYVGIDPRADIRWVATHSFDASLQHFVDGKVDAFLAFEPQPHELRARGIGKVVVNTTEDRPWSQYFCCMVTAGREFAARYPMATKRALRAILKAADICANEPERAARYLADKGYEKRYDLSLDVLKSLPYRRWRDADPEDSLRFHALRLHEVGMIKTSPQKLLARSTDWRLLGELKRELKA
jgi:NitT/TauT family transport system substrate-binding protein